MTKYFRCFKSGQYITAGKRYEIIAEVDGLFVFLDDDGVEHCWSIEPGGDGGNYRDHFILETDDKPIDGRKAEVIHPGRRWTSYYALSAKLGYPDASRDYGEDDRVHPKEGDVVTILSATDLAGDAVVHDGNRVYVVESENGEHHTFSEKGLRILSDSITVLPDESLGGIGREYREVNRKADEGETAKVIGPSGHKFSVGTIVKATSEKSAVTDGVRFINKCGDLVQTLVHTHGDYVVLEPTDIVHLPIKGHISGTERLRMVDRKATVGERVIMTEATGTRIEGGRSVPDYHNGNIFEIARINDGADLATSTSGKMFYQREYHVLEPLTDAPLLSEQSAQDQAAATISSLALRLGALTERIDTLEAKVDAVYTTQPTTAVGPEAVLKAVRKFSEGLKRSVSDALKTPQQRRDEIVERAKADVADLRKYKGTPIPNDTVCFRPLTKQTKDYVPMHTVEYVVNRNKRAVVAIIRCTCDGHITRGIAKCAPGDVFNAHIGKAIALYRALGLEVPADYLNVPKPTEVRVGDVVEGTSHSGAIGPVLEIGHDGEENFVIYRNDTDRRYVNKCWSGVTRVIILDDTREEVAA
ncbi:hypothetical protein [Paenibacillus terrae]|uniref:hypothetical protein n=1 Tax=Paenibacillus terrae TaxID=159743 RepID=UPI0011EB8B7D|nr:hypothetical protein [Paenibacillus terrae]